MFYLYCDLFSVDSVGSFLSRPDFCFVVIIMLLRSFWASLEDMIIGPGHFVKFSTTVTLTGSCSQYVTL